MIALKFLVLLSITVVIASSHKVAHIEVTSRSIASIIDILSEKKFLRFVLAVEKNDNYLARLADKILKNTSATIGLISVRKDMMHYLDLDFSYFFLVSKDIHFDYLKSDKYRSKKNMIFFYPKDSLEKSMKTLRNEITSRHRQNKFLLLHSDNKDSMELFNYVLFQPNSCKAEWKLSYSFSASTMKWNTTDFIQYKNNYFGCKMNINAKIYSPSNILSLIEVKNNDSTAIGIIPEILGIFAKKYNIKFNYVKLKQTEVCGLFTEEICVYDAPMGF